MPYNSESLLANSNAEQFLTDINFMSPVGFALTIDNLKFKNVSFLVQRASIPDLNIDSAPVNYKNLNIGVHADKATYAPLECQFIIDENLINYQEIHDWIKDQITDSDTVKKTRDITLHIMSSHNNVIREIQFIDAFPTSLSSLEFDTTQTDIEYLVANVSFRYSYYKIL